MNTHFDQQYIDSLGKLQDKWEVSDEEYENLRSSWIMNSQLTNNEILAIEKWVRMWISNSTGWLEIFQNR